MCVEKISEYGIQGVDTTINFQLNAEDALTISNYDRLVFVDASVAVNSGFELRPLIADDAITFSTHAMSPAAILALSDALYQKKPQAWVLHIRGYEWEFGLPLSEGAEQNIQAAKAFLINWLAEEAVA